MRWTAPLLLAFLVASSCSSTGTSTKADGKAKRDDLDLEPKVEAKQAPKAIDPCAPAQLGLGAARTLKPWAAPTTCTGTSGATGPTSIRSEAEFAKRFSCPAGTTSGIDFATQMLVVEDRSLSPAGAGTIIVDDGARITFIERQRSPCPDDPKPMPMDYTLGFLLPAGAERTYTSRACTLPPTCGR
jgi:hypothetical protein